MRLIVLLFLTVGLGSVGNFYVVTQERGDRHAELYTRARKLANDRDVGIVLVDTMSRRVAIGSNWTKIGYHCAKSLCAANRSL